MWKVYKYLFPNGKVYIGRSGNLKTRQRTGYGDTLVGKAINEFGWESVEQEILAEVNSVEEADILEKHYIQKYKALDFTYGYNMTPGGTGGCAISKYKKPMSAEARKKIGENSKKHLTGRKLSEETRAKISASNKGHIVTESTRKKISDANIGRHPSDETRLKLSLNNKAGTPEVRKKLSESLKKSGAERARKRKETIAKRYPGGLRRSEETKKQVSEKLKGVPKSEETKQKMRKPKSAQQKENMRKAQRIRREAEKLGYTYFEYKQLLENK